MTDTQPALGDLSGAGADELAALVGSVPDEQLAEGMASDGRRAVLDEIFRRMADHAEPEKIAGKDAVVHFKITGRPGGGADEYEVVLRDGACTVSDSPSQPARVTLTVEPVAFLKLVSGVANGPELFMSGKLAVQGDLAFAATMTSFFRIPKAG